MIGLLIGLLIVAIGLYMILASGGGSPIGVAALTAGMLAVVLFALLQFFSVFTTVSVLGVVLGAIMRRGESPRPRKALMVVCYAVGAGIPALLTLGFL